MSAGAAQHTGLPTARNYTFHAAQVFFLAIQSHIGQREHGESVRKRAKRETETERSMAIALFIVPALAHAPSTTSAVKPTLDLHSIIPWWLVPNVNRRQFDNPSYFSVT